MVFVAGHFSKGRKAMANKAEFKNKQIKTPKTKESFWVRLEHGLQIGLRASLASLLAAWVAFRLGMDYPIYAVISAVVVTDSSPEVTRRLGLSRLFGTLFGACWGAFLATHLGHSSWVMASGVLLAILFCDLVGLRDTQRITGYITAIVILFHGDSPWVYAKDRFIETTLGLAFAVLVGMVMESVMKRMKLKLQF